MTRTIEMGVLTRGTTPGLLEELEMLHASQGREALVRDMLAREADRRLCMEGHLLHNHDDIEPGIFSADLVTLYELGFISYPITKSRRLSVEDNSWRDAPQVVEFLAGLETAWSYMSVLDPHGRGLSALQRALAQEVDKGTAPPFPLYVSAGQSGWDEHHGLMPMMGNPQQLVEFGRDASPPNSVDHEAFRKFVRISHAYVNAHWAALDRMPS